MIIFDVFCLNELFDIKKQVQAEHLVFREAVEVGSWMGCRDAGFARPFVNVAL
jgi:hypothetical protein